MKLLKSSLFFLTHQAGNFKYNILFLTKIARIKYFINIKLDMMKFE